MTALIHAELLKLRTTRTFAAIVGTALALSLVLVALAASLGAHNDPHALFTNSSLQPTTASIQRVRVPSWELSDLPR